VLRYERGFAAPLPSLQRAGRRPALARTIKTQHAASMRSLDPLSNPDAPAFVQFLNSSSIPGSP
jgi:hypothetical protein